MRSRFGPLGWPVVLQTAGVLVVWPGVGDLAAEDPAPALVDQLSAVVREIYDAIAPGDRGVWERRLADDSDVHWRRMR